MGDIRVKANVNIGGLQAGQIGTLPDDDKTQEWVDAGLVTTYGGDRQAEQPQTYGDLTLTDPVPVPEVSPEAEPPPA